MLVLAGCLLDKGELVEDVPPGFCDTLEVSYQGNLKTVIDASCANSVGCHGNQSVNGDFTSYATMQAAGVLEPGKIAARVNATDVSEVMPPGNPLPDSVQQIFQCWMNTGFPQQ